MRRAGATLEDFDTIFDLVAQAKGGAHVVEQLLAETRSRSPTEIAAIPDDRILAAMTRLVFSAGFSSKVIDAKWDAFESAFDYFDPSRCALMSDDRLDDLLKNKGIIRNGAKIHSVQENALFLIDLAREHGSAARFFAGWPDSDCVGLLDLLKKRASRMGGATGMRFLRSIGKPVFIPTPDVVKALIREGVLASAPSGKRDFATMQAAFNAWSEQSGLDLTSLSRVLAMSVN